MFRLKLKARFIQLLLKIGNYMGTSIVFALTFLALTYVLDESALRIGCYDYYFFALSEI